MKAIRFFCIGIATLYLILLSAEQDYAAGAEYPTRPINIIVGYQPGSTDVQLRPFIEKMSGYLGQPMTFTFKPGAAGTVGAEFMLASKPDGYNLFGSSQSAIVLNPLVNREEVHYTFDSFTPICNMVESYSIMFVKSDARWKDLPQLVAEAKKNPGKINFTSPGVMAMQHLLVEAFCREAGIKMNHIPAQGGGPAIVALLGGHVDMAVGSLPTGAPHVLAGTLRPIGIFSEKRSRAFPDYPTVVEHGYSVGTTMVYGLVGPKNIPREVVKTLNAAAKKALENHKPYLLERYDKLGAEILYLPSEEYDAKFRSEHVFFSNAIKGLTK